MKKVKFRILIAVFFMLAILAAGMFSPANFVASYAAETTYSPVLEDLKKDSAFRSADYPVDNQDNSLQVIQIAESANAELFVYVYQPCTVRDLSATSISISVTINEAFAPKLYTLKKLNAQGVFGKYLVNGFKVQSGRERYYDITEIFRTWIKGIDDPDENGNVISEVSFEVGKLYTATTENGNVKYDCRKSETISVISKYCGYLRPKNGSITSVYSYDEHFLAFNTDIPIDELYEADVSFSIRMRRRNWIDGAKVNDYYMTEFVSDQITVTCEELTDASFTVPWQKPKTWKTIERVSDFIAKEKLSDEAKKNLAGKQWVLRFLRTPYVYNVSGFPPLLTADLTTQELADETILRLKFETAGKTYNLGVVDNKQSPDPDAPPDNKPDNPMDNGILEWFKRTWDSIVRFFTGGSDWWVYVLVVVIALIILPTVIGLLIPAFGKLLFNLLKKIGKGLWRLITAPFRAIAWLFKKIFGKE